MSGVSFIASALVCRVELFEGRRTDDVHYLDAFVLGWGDDGSQIIPSANDEGERDTVKRPRAGQPVPALSRS